MAASLAQERVFMQEYMSNHSTDKSVYSTMTEDIMLFATYHPKLVEEASDTQCTT